MISCKTCNIKKPKIEFYKTKNNKSGLTTNCKKCTIIERSKYASKHKISIRKYQKNYRKKYYEENKIELNEKHKRYYYDNKESSSFKKHRKAYLIRNKEQICKRNRKYMKQLRKNSPEARIASNLRSRLYSALKGNYKSGSAVKDLGCSIQEFKIWLEFNFKEGMNWNNYGRKPGQWSIDHITPISSFDLSDRNQLLAACNYKNLRPLWHCGENGNASKGNKI